MSSPLDGVAVGDAGTPPAGREATDHSAFLDILAPVHHGNGMGRDEFILLVMVAGWGIPPDQSGAAWDRAEAAASAHWQGIAAALTTPPAARSEHSPAEASGVDSQHATAPVSGTPGGENQ